MWREKHHFGAEYQHMSYAQGSLSPGPDSSPLISYFCYHGDQGDVVSAQRNVHTLLHLRLCFPADHFLTAAALLENANILLTSNT